MDGFRFMCARKDITRVNKWEKKVLFHSPQPLFAPIAIGKLALSDSRKISSGKNPINSWACSCRILMRSSSTISCL
jgi:hypothetical protein